MGTFFQVATGVLLMAQIGTSSGQDEARIARGKYLMEGVVACGNCHIARGEKGEPIFSKGLSGGMVFDEPPFKAFAPNITPDPETGIGKWTDAQLGKAIREGIRPDGSIIGPPMPIEFYRRISDADLEAIIAYLRVQPPVKNAVEKSKYNIPLPPNYGQTVKDIRAPSPKETIKYGEYLANIGHCMECHTPRDEKGMLRLTRLGAGGQVFKGPWGESVARNLTPHESGLKGWTNSEIALAIRGTDKNGVHYKPPMAFDWYKNINAADMNALIAYLGSLKPQPFAGRE
ncbi:cytochrome c [Cupriavidus sp. TA19]|uniref:c-type cytochrome n=1 Tax=unclassified Cupriavidus TaxID=2640874 RepID=UPI000E2F6817|nr:MULTISPECIES: c-type cytochrome [unclassified Cupriavidus]BDB29321.1 c-type cytochrome [Cupriavidus sp. P-10]GLC95829.1 cytochrome c [Cupriavidus sp. TA19]